MNLFPPWSKCLQYVNGKIPQEMLNDGSHYVNTVILLLGIQDVSATSF